MSNLLDANLVKLLNPEGYLRTLIITVGNILRADDGVGPYISSCLKPSLRLAVIEAGSAAENIIEEAVKLAPQRIIFIDAADFSGTPGELRLIDPEHLPQTSLTTHSIPLSVVSRILEEDTAAEIFFLGIQPKSVGHQEGLSSEVKSTADVLIKHISREFKDA